jgi:hypothetical protein
VQPAAGHNAEDRADDRRRKEMDQRAGQHRRSLEPAMRDRRRSPDDGSDLLWFEPGILAQRQREEQTDDRHRQAATKAGECAAQPDDIREPRGSALERRCCRFHVHRIPPAHPIGQVMDSHNRASRCQEIGKQTVAMSIGGRAAPDRNP